MKAGVYCWECSGLDAWDLIRVGGAGSERRICTDDVRSIFLLLAAALGNLQSVEMDVDNSASSVLEAAPSVVLLDHLM
jgi:hypothetical protein